MTWLHVLIARCYGQYLCQHRSHRLRLHCWRLATWDHQCGKHNYTCFHACPEKTPAPARRAGAGPSKEKTDD